MVAIPKRYTTYLVAKRQLTSTVYSLLFQATKSLIYQPGQYASWIIGPHRRPMSFAVPPAGTRTEFIVDISLGGVASHFIQTLKTGDKLEFLAPYGRFVLDPSDTLPRLFLATGTGIAPIRAQLLADDSKSKAILVFGARLPSHRFLDHELAVLAQQKRNLTFIPVCLHHSPEWSGAVGHVVQVAVSSLKQLENHIVYVCGSPQFVTETTGFLIAHGLPRQHIKSEQYTVSQTVLH